MSKGSINQIPCREGLLSTPAGSKEKPQLIGSKCPKCGEIVFPKNPVCINCQNQTMKDVTLSRKGKIWSFSTVMLRPPDWYKGPVPFDVGYVELQEGIRIWTRLLGAEAGTFKIGQEVELDVDVLQVDKDGNEILGFCFVPAKN
jgi:uncharacterized protein